MKSPLSFIKSCALGNDFVIVFETIPHHEKEIVTLSKKLADRRWGIGCDQVIYVSPAHDKHCYTVRFFNADGSMAEACGNGSRCVAKILIQQHNFEKVILQTQGGALECKLLEDGTVSVVFPKPLCVKTVDLGYPSGLFLATIFVDMGNPHLVCFVDDRALSQKWGPILETHLPEIDPAMPSRVNVGFAKIVDRHRLLLTVWERGAGFTQSCGTGACAAVAAAKVSGLVDQPVQVHQKGGDLIVQLDEQNLRLQGEAYVIYRGTITLD